MSERLPRPDPDQQLLDDVRQDKPGAHRRLFDRFWLPVLRMALARFANRLVAEDAAIEALTDVFRGIARFEGRSRLETWVYRVAWNRVQVMHRRLARERATVRLEDRPDLVVDCPGPAEQHEERAEFVRMVERIHALLPPDQAQAMVLCELVGLEQDEAARVLEIRPATLRKRLSRARAALRAQGGDADEQA
jgi:RNA polymerase sigma-70 factor (ECF subfamily)